MMQLCDDPPKTPRRPTPYELYHTPVPGLVLVAGLFVFYEVSLLGPVALVLGLLVLTLVLVPVCLLLAWVISCEIASSRLGGTNLKGRWFLFLFQIALCVLAWWGYTSVLKHLGDLGYRVYPK